MLSWPIIKRIVLFFLGIYLLANILFYWFQEKFLIEQTKDPTGYVARDELRPSFDEFLAPPGKLLPGADKKAVKINFQKYDSTNKPAKGIIFYLHGNRGSIDKCRWEIEPFLSAGYDVWIMDYRSFGKSTGPLSEINLLADAQMVYACIAASEKADKREIIIWGRSFGTGIATYVASANSPKTLVLETPYWSLPDAVCHSRPYLFSAAFRYQLPTYKYLEYVKCKVHLIHGKNDEKIYFRSSERLKVLCDKLKIEVQTHWINNGLHNLRTPSQGQSQEFDAAVKESLD